MGRFWGSSQALAYATGLVLAAGLLHACDLNPQPAPPAKELGSDASGGPAATSTTGSATAGGMQPPGMTSGEPQISGNGTTGGTGVDDPDDGVDSESPSTATTSTTSGGGAVQGSGGAGGAAGAAGEAEGDGALPSEPTNGPR